jgi:hypothetical protein
MATSSKALPTEVGMLVVRSRFNIQRSLQVDKDHCRLRRITTELADPHSQTTALPVAGWASRRCNPCARVRVSHCAWRH